jgi:putative transport protein
VAVSVLFGFDEGIAVGLLSGGMTQSASLGTGLNAIAELPLPDDVKAKLSAHAPLADAITYGFGDLGLILFLTWLGPLIMRADLRREARELESQLGGGAAGQTLAGTHFAFRVHRIKNPANAGATVSEFETRYAEGRLSVQRVKRVDDVLEPRPGLELKQGDLVVIGAWVTLLSRVEREIGPEESHPDLLAIPLKTVSVVVTSKEVHGRTIAELGKLDRARGVYLESLQRGEEFMPHEPWTVIERGDILRLVGAPADVDRAAAAAGFVERDSARTDLGFLAAGICVGIVFGMVKVMVGDIAFGLGTSGAILVVGLLAGWARSRYPVFGAIPVPAQRLLMDIGLIVFIAIVGLHAGPHAVEAYHQSGGAFFGRILVAGMIVTVLPLAAGLIVARYVLRMNPMMVVGSLAGAQTCTPGLNALREASGSNIGALAYTVPYALNNILLTIWGPVVVGILYAIRH